MTLLVLPNGVPAAVGRRILDAAYDGMPYQCTSCQRQGRLGDGGPPVTAQIHISTTGTVLTTLLHLACGPGTVTVTTTEPDLQHTEPASFALPVILPRCGGGWPALLVELAASGTMVHLLDDTDIVLGTALALGMVPVADPAYPPTPPHPLWRVELPAPGRPGGRILGARGMVLHEPLDNIRLTPHWRPALDDHGGYCAVYLLSRVGLLTHVANQPAPAAAAVLDHAARAGRIVGLTCTVTTGDPT